jgi:hypothetical protein
MIIDGASGGCLIDDHQMDASSMIIRWMPHRWAIDASSDDHRMDASSDVIRCDPM